MEKKIGEKLLKKVKSLEHVFNLKEEKQGIYSFQTPSFQIQLIAIPGEEVGITVELKNSGRPVLFYTVDNDLYKLNDIDNYEINESIETEIVDIIKAVQENRIVLGARKKRKAFVIPMTDDFILTYQGRFVLSYKRYKSYEEVISKGGFIPNK